MSPVSNLPIMDPSICKSRIRITRAMESLVSLANKLISPHKNPDFHEEMQENVKHAYEEMTAAKEQLENELRTIDPKTVDLANNLGLNKQLNDTKLKLSQLKIQLKYQEETNQYVKEMVRTAKEHLGKLQEMEKKVRQEEKWYTIARNIALVFMPLSTLMAGIVSAIFQTSLYTAQRTAQELQEAIGLYQTKVFKYQNEFSKSNKVGDEITENIQANEKRTEEIEEERKKRLKSLGKEEEQQNQLRKHVIFLGLLVGNVKTLRLKVEFHKDEVVLKLLEDILKEWRKEDGQELLNFLDGEEIKDHIGKLNDTIQNRAVNKSKNF